MAKALLLGLSLLLVCPVPALAREISAARVHVVQPGQTLGKIARRYNVSIEALCKANGVRKNQPIKPRQKLAIPTSEGTASKVQDRRTEAKHEAAVRPAALRRAPAVASSAQLPRKDPYAKKPRRRGYVTLSSYTGSWSGYAVLKGGQISAEARRGFMKVLASWRTGDQEKIHGELIRLVVRVSDHFGGRPIRVVSGYRPPSERGSHSQHNLGRAIDFSIQGVPNTVVRDYCRMLGSVGVGYYPNSSFVHLDIRGTPTYWVDYAGPGQRPRYAHEGYGASTRHSAVTAGTTRGPARGDGAPDDASDRAAASADEHQEIGGKEPRRVDSDPPAETNKISD
jgi:uncharacterized protein YcbK (DUF882 family)